MAFVSARTIAYKNIVSPDGTPTAIAITGEIIDDTIPAPYLGTCWIEGDEFNNLPATDPALDGTPNDPRYQAIMGHVLAYTQSRYAEWVASYHARPVEVERTPDEIAALPVITTLV